MRFVVVTGMSGGGKRTALKLLEDAGFYCVDNLPVSLVEKFVELIAMPGSEISKVALGLDVRADQNFTDATRILEQLKEKGYKFEILFMDSDDSALIKRYKETRRVHPLAADGRVEDGIHKERKILETIRKNSDYVIDTSNLLVRELKEELDRIFVQNEEYNSLMVTVMSFGFKHGIPADADLVFDVRFLPNPYYIEELKPQTGNDKGRFLLCQESLLHHHIREAGIRGYAGRHPDFWIFCNWYDSAGCLHIVRHILAFLRQLSWTSRERVRLTCSFLSAMAERSQVMEGVPA